MEFRQTSIPGCVQVDVEPHKDDRGQFARTWCAREFANFGLPAGFVQASISRNPHKGTLRGVHFQQPPSSEGKLVRAVRGAVFDVVVDLRASSATFLHHIAVELSVDNLAAIFIPPGCAHGFQTLVGDTDVLYQMTDFYAPELGAGLRWDDPALGIDWPLPDPIMNDRDREYPDLSRGELAGLEWA